MATPNRGGSTYETNEMAILITQHNDANQSNHNYWVLSVVCSYTMDPLEVFEDPLREKKCVYAR
jgi:hypothetical protein